MYGVCCDHPFFNGNKRTALVAMLVHLDSNKLSLFQTSQSDLYKMIIGVASHSFGLRTDPRRSRVEPRRHQNSDEEVTAVSEWLGKRASRVVRGEKPITFRELRRILESFGYTFDSPKGNYIDIVRPEEESVGVLRKRTRTVKKRIGNIPYPGEHEEVGVKVVKRIRQMCLLTEEHGVDSASFYDRAVVIDAFVNRYRTLLRRLARR
jgi:death-on-curing protein